MNYPKITLITPVLNSEKTLEKTIQSVLTQNYPNLEYLVIDGGSSDRSLEIISRYQDQLIFLGSQKDNGPADAYNRALEKASGEIVGMLSADDWLMPGVLMEMGAIFDRHPDIDVVSGRAEVVEEIKENVYVSVRRYGYKHTAFTFESILRHPMTNSRFFRLRVFKECGYFKAYEGRKRILSADKELLLRFALKQIKNFRYNEIVYVYLRHDQAITTTNKISRKFDVHWEFYELYQEILKDWPLTPIQQKLIKQFQGIEMAYIATRGLVFGEYGMTKKAFQLGLKLENIKFIWTIAKSTVELMLLGSLKAVNIFSKKLKSVS